MKKTLSRSSQICLAAMLVAGCDSRPSAPLAPPALPIPTVFGVQLGKPIQSVPCSGWPEKVACLSAPLDKQGLPKARGGEISMLFPTASMPRWVTGPSVRLELVEGSVEKITIYTPGTSEQQQALTDLITKFGPPSKQEIKPMQNGFGAQFDVVDATWQRADWRVWFAGSLSRFDTGVVVISTKRWDDESSKRRETAPKQQKL